MLTFLRKTPKLTPQSIQTPIRTRSFAKVLSASSPGTPPSGSTSRALESTQLTEHDLGQERIPVKEDHGLYAFFRKRIDPNLDGDARYDTVEPRGGMHAMPSGRGWKASELRLKSFNDLHTLWYIVLRERNLLATQKEEARRMGVTNSENQVSLEKVHECRKTMARIKAVINERRLAYEGAVRLVEKQREYVENEKVLQYEVAEHRKERKYLMRRREHVARKRKKAEEGAKGVKMEMEAKREVDKPRELMAKGEATDVEKGMEAAAEVEVQNQVVGVQEAEVVEVVEEPDASPPMRPADTATAGLFGDQAPRKTRGRRTP